LINNDMVKELDDIEAISQQISQHAEVLYNSWKTAGMTQGPSQFKLSTAAGAASPDISEASSSLRERGGSLKQPSHYTRQAGYSDLGPGHRQITSDSSASPRQSTSSVSSPTSSSRESPARGSSLTQINTEVGPLELLASPNLNGNLEDLVSSFVNTDRAKQAARNTISSTLMRRLGSPNGSASPVRSPSPSSPLSYRSGSPLRSPMLTNSVPTRASLASPEVSPPNMFPSDNQDVHSPIQSIFSKGPNSSQQRKANNSLHHTFPMSKSPGASSTNSNDIHKAMQPMFSQSQNSKLSPLHVQTETSEGRSIPIPVKHIPIAVTPSSSDGLKSPTVLQNANKNPFQMTVQQQPTDNQSPMPNLFNQFGEFRDPEARILEMRRRFEEAKQRMALSLPAREGGVRPNSFGSMGKSTLDSPWADDPSAFLLEQFRRRNKRRMEMPSAPHPELTPEQKQHISERSSSGLMPVGNPLRRMLPGGSVAERVLMFEKSPSAFGVEPAQVRVPQRREPQLTGTVITPWRSSLNSQSQTSSNTERIVPINRIESLPKILESSSPTLPSTVTTGHLTNSWQPPVAQTFPRRTTQPSTTFRPPSLHLPGKEEIPKFYFPNGNPTGKLSVDAVTKKFTEAFSKQSHSSVTTEQLGQILKTSGYPLYWKCPVFISSGGDKVETVTLLQLTKTWRRLLLSCHDDAAQFVAFLTQGSRSYLVPEDFVPLIQDVVDTHPGLLFLKEATEFHSRYVHTVIARIFYEVNRSWSGKITVSELRRSKFLTTLKLLQDEDDINQVTDFFSYEHFYVIYCKFWELDKDHDLFIDREDLSRHNEHALSTRMIERIFSGAVTRGTAQKEGRMSYTEFVWFLLSEEDKRHSTAIEYWFRCMDLDGDGVLSMYELEFFYEEQLQRMEQLGIETLPFDDCLCQMLDMIRPATKNKITLQDLKRCKMTPVFFDTFFNLEKYLDHEQRDPFATQREVDEDGNELSDWDRFAADEYEQLVAEEGNNELMDDM